MSRCPCPASRTAWRTPSFSRKERSTFDLKFDFTVTACMLPQALAATTSANVRAMPATPRNDKPLAASSIKPARKFGAVRLLQLGGCAAGVALFSACAHFSPGGATAPAKSAPAAVPYGGFSLGPGGGGEPAILGILAGPGGLSG